jgi:hypothetical protein
LVKCFDNKHTLLYAVRHPAQHTLFTGLQTHDIPASSGTTRYFSHQSFSSGARFKLLNDFLNVYKQLPAVAGNFSLHHLVKNGSGAHPACQMGTRGSFPGGKAAGSWSWQLNSIWWRGQRMSGAIPSLPSTPSWRGAQFKKKRKDNFTFTQVNRDSSVSIVSRLQAGQRGFHSRKGLVLFSLRLRVQTGSGAHSATYSVVSG